MFNWFNILIISPVFNLPLGCIAFATPSANDAPIVISPRANEEALKVEAKEGRIADLPTVGSVAVMNNKGCAIHRDAENFEIDFIGSLLKLECESATVNMGNPFLSSGILVNSNGFIVGDISGGPEVTYLDEIFGFLE